MALQSTWELCLYSFLIPDSGKQEALWRWGWSFTGAIFLQDTRELPMEGLGSLGVWNDGDVTQKDLCNGLAWAPRVSTNMGTLSSAQGAEPFFLSKVSPAGRLSATCRDFSLICSTMTHTFFLMLAKVCYYPLWKWCCPLSWELAEPPSPSAGLVPCAYPCGLLC